MKRIIPIVLIALMIFNITCITAYASENYVISGTEVTASKNNKVSVPIELKNNKGIMGFKITVEYDPEKIDITSVERGTLTSDGNFTTNFGTLGSKFDVVWNNVKEISNDGSLFVLTVLCKKSDSIKLTFSQQDTFNEKYEDVYLNCNDVPINYSSKPKSTTAKIKRNKQNESTSVKSTAVVDNSQILKAIRTTLSDYGYKSLNDVENNEQFVKSFNKNLSKIVGTDEYKVSDMKTLKKIYVSAVHGEYVKEASNSIGSEGVNNTISASLHKLNAKSIDDIPDNQKSQFIKLVENELQEKDPNLPSLSANLSVDESFEVIKDLDLSSPPQTEGSISKSNNKSNKIKDKKHNAAFYIVLIVCIAISVAAVVFVTIKKKRKN